MMIIGLTGLIGSGKTTVANLFADLGATIIDTDLIAHQLTTQYGAAIAPLCAEFGAGVLDVSGKLRRDYLRDMIFKNDSKRQLLEQILHPLILSQVQVELSLASHVNYVILVVPLLFRSLKYLQLTQRNIFVDCDYDLLLERLAKRSNLTQSQVDAILIQQVSRDQQLELADDIIENNGDTQSLVVEVNRLHQQYLLGW